ncbi:unnamed protein product [Soboliphyme baturini]|uniref:ATP-synt_DE_N domain-containing protein n=1 Tax=Soboliphyme baturini TaxID=241478 RepID=A0A183J812_9BILA|nr:unnamed protein product [Soboliphyme baturini]
MPAFICLFRSSLVRLGSNFGRRLLATESAAEKISLTFASPSQVFYSNVQVLQVTAPTIDGEVGVYPTHVPLVGVLRPGIVSVQEDASTAKRLFGRPGNRKRNVFLTRTLCGCNLIQPI